MADELQIKTETVCAIEINGVVCTQELNYDDDRFPDGRCKYHCRVRTETGLCGLTPMANGFCHKHGGAAITPAAHYWEHSILARERGRKLPNNLQKIYQMAVGDPDLLSHRPDLAVLEARIQMLMKEVEAGSSEKLLNNLLRQVEQTRTKSSKIIGKLRTALQEDNISELPHLIDEIEREITLSEMNDLLMSEAKQYAAWREITDILDKARVTRDSEIKRLEQQKKFVSTERVLAGIAGVSEQIKNIVTRHADKKTARLILAEIGQAMREFVGE